MTDYLVNRQILVGSLSVQHNDGFLPDMILLIQSYYHWETRFNVLKRFVFAAYDPA